MSNPYVNATPARPDNRYTAPIRMSAPHSHATHGWPGFENENGSACGSDLVRIIRSPSRMCQPASVSRKSDVAPWNITNIAPSVTSANVSARSGTSQASHRAAAGDSSRCDRPLPSAKFSLEIDFTCPRTSQLSSQLAQIPAPTTCPGHAVADLPDQASGVHASRLPGLRKVTVESSPVYTSLLPSRSKTRALLPKLLSRLARPFVS